MALIVLLLIIFHQKINRGGRDLDNRIAIAPSRKTEVYTFALCPTLIRTKDAL
jgi:hypothetical protein